MNSEPTEWDEKREHDRDLEYESRQDYESWNTETDESDQAEELREHMKQMVAHAKHLERECKHKYREEVAAPLGVRCLKCGHFVGAHE